MLPNQPLGAGLRRPLSVITGANVGLGRATAIGLARAGHDVVLLGRSRLRHTETLDACRQLAASATHVELDLSDLQSVAAAISTLRTRGAPITTLILNAGVAGVQGLTEQGFELAFGVNHVGHFLLVSGLLPLLQLGAPARIVTVASRAHFEHRAIAWPEVREPTRTLTGWYEYGRSKLANLLTSRSLGRELAGSGVTTYGLHPGVVATEIWRPVPAPIRRVMKLFMQSPKDAAETSLHCALAPELAGETGLYYERVARAEPAPVVDDDFLAEELLTRSRNWIAPFLDTALGEVPPPRSANKCGASS